MSTEHAHSYTIDEACDEIASLQLHTDSDLARFSEVAVRYLIPVIRTDYKLDLLTILT